ncbi:unnamed protein product [Leptidea sinapis]|uniref:Uncharacterized protein n=2 Tax=Leptidea sinapis TaxID=189913 RepID=A0A5E4Q6M9_9NEOP|nr:unnamed protein product [Leptidea sinapis]
MVSVFEEKYNYDWNLFLADLGGSVGFLLGLSVIGVINILYNVWWEVLKPLLCWRRHRNSSAGLSDTTLDAKSERNHVY